MSLAELNRYNFRFNAMPTSVPSGMYGIILKNSNASVVHNLLLNSDETIKANFGVFDNSNLLCTKNLISGDVVKLQGNSYVSEFDNGISGSIPRISVKCNSFYNFPTNLVSGDLDDIPVTSFITSADTEFTGNSVWSRYLINDGINYKLSDVQQNTIFWNTSGSTAEYDEEQERIIEVNFDSSITLSGVQNHLSRIPKNLNGRTLKINFSEIIGKTPIKIANFYNGKVIVNGKVTEE
jgi:hypothetical protein